MNHDVETGYDRCALVLETAGGEIELWSADGTASALAIGGSHVYQPGDYLAGGQVAVLFRVTSDGGWSDEDCAWPTAGAMQLDDVVVTLSNGPGMSHDFEDGSLGPLVARPAVGVGNFARIWQQLEDLDPCVSNYTPQVAFIDDGTVVPGTGGSMCLNWCYGPNGYIVNTTGGLAGPDHHLHNAVRSPVMAWPDQAMNGASLAYTAMLHEDLSTDAPGMFHFWEVRSTASGDRGGSRGGALAQQPDLLLRLGRRVPSGDLGPDGPARARAHPRPDPGGRAGVGLGVGLQRRRRLPGTLLRQRAPAGLGDGRPGHHGPRR